MEQQTGSKLGKEYIKAVYWHTAYLTYMQNTSWDMLGWMKHRLESRLLGEISITSDMSEKVGLKYNIRKTKIMASGPKTSWQIDEETMETVRLYFWGLQNHCR